jgi:type I restriction enzyme R subunit
MKFESERLNQIFKQIRELNRKNSMLIAKFGGDRKFAVVYKNAVPSGKVSDNLELYNLLTEAKSKIDARLSQNQNLLANTGYFRQATGEDVLESFQSGSYKVDAQTLRNLIEYTADEYISEYQGE